MKRTFVAIVCVVLATACSGSKKADESAAPAGSPQPAPAATPAAAPATEPAKVEITDELVTKYVEYQKQEHGILAKYAEDMKKTAASAKNDTAKSLQALSVVDKFNKDMEAALKAKRSEVGLSEEQFGQLREAATSLATGRLLYNQMGGDAQLAKMEAEQKQQLAVLSGAQRAEAEKAFAEMSRNLREMKDGLELRKKFGDKSTDALLKHAEELAKQHFDNLKLLGDK
jgi:hypothetical protein